MAQEVTPAIATALHEPQVHGAPHLALVRAAGISQRDRAGREATIEPDLIDGPLITRLFERFAKGDVSIKMLTREFTTIRGRRFYPAQIHKALRKRIY